MVTGMDLLVDRLFAYLYQAAGEGQLRTWSKAELMEALGCAYSPTFRQALAWAEQSGVIESYRTYHDSRHKKYFHLTTEAIEAAQQDLEAQQNAPALPF